MEGWEPRVGKLLVVHADGSVRDTLAHRLSESGYVVFCAEEGPKALELMRAESAELVLVDIQVPEMGGEAFVAAVRSDEATQDAPVILLAQDGEANIVEGCLRAGADDFLYAPFSATLLRSQVADYLRIARARSQDRQRIERETLLKIERDVQIGRQIQLGFLPTDLPTLDGWEIAARFHPAREVAGDFYDAFTLSHGRRVGFLVADVCDKGVGAALFMALFRSLYRAYAMQNYSMRWTDVLEDDFSPQASSGRQRTAPSTGSTALKNAMDLTNDYIVRNHADANMFATTFFGVLDPANGQLMYVNGGHNPPRHSLGGK